MILKKRQRCNGGRRAGLLLRSSQQSECPARTGRSGKGAGAVGRAEGYGGAGAAGT